MATLSQAGIAGISSGVLHPKAKNRWRVVFSGLGAALGSNGNIANDLSSQIVTFTRPNYSFEEVQMDRYNTRIYIAGKHQFEPCSMSIEDDVTNRAAAAIQAQMERQQRLIGATGPWLNTEATALGYKFGMTFEQLDGNETVVEQWKYEGCFIQSVDHGEGDYSTGTQVVISMVVRFDQVRQILENTVTGSAIGGLINN